MNKAVELMVRAHLEKSSLMESFRGKQNLDGEVIWGVFAKLQQEKPVGSDLLMMKYLEDAPALKRVQNTLKEKVVSTFSLKRGDLVVPLVDLALTLFMGYPLPAQIKTLESLWLKHSEQAKRSKRRIKELEVKLKNVDRQIAETEFRQKQQEKERRQYELLIKEEQKRLNNYAQKQARHSNLCPRCRGTGITKGEPCTSCKGKGRVEAGKGSIRDSLRATGIRFSESLWRNELNPLIDGVVGFCHSESFDAAERLNWLLEAEKQAV